MIRCLGVEVTESGGGGGRGAGIVITVLSTLPFNLGYSRSRSPDSSMKSPG